MSHVWRTLIGAIILTSLAFTAGAQQVPAVQSELIYTLGEGESLVINEHYIVTGAGPAGWALATHDAATYKTTIHTSTAVFGPYTSISSWERSGPRIANDGSAWAIFASNGSGSDTQRYCITNTGIELGPYGRIHYESIFFGNEGIWSFVNIQAGSVYVQTNATVLGPFISTDWRPIESYAYRNTVRSATEREGKYYLTMHDYEYGPFSRLNNLKTEGEQWIVAATNDRGLFLLINGVEYGPFKGVGDPRFIDQIGWATVVATDEGSGILIDGQMAGLVAGRAATRRLWYAEDNWLVNATVDGKTFLAHTGTTWGPFDAVIDVQIHGDDWFALVEQEGERYVASAAGTLTPIGKTRYLLIDQQSGDWVAAEEQGEEVVLRDDAGEAIVSLGLVASREPNPYQDQWSWKDDVLTFADGDVYEGGFNVFAFDDEGTPTAFFYAVRDNEVFYHRKPLRIP